MWANGSKVVCIQDSPLAPFVQGRTYTCVGSFDIPPGSIFCEVHGMDKGCKVGLDIAEIPNEAPFAPGAVWYGWCGRCFRLLYEPGAEELTDNALDKRVPSKVLEDA